MGMKECKENCNECSLINVISDNENDTTIYNCEKYKAYKKSKVKTKMIKVNDDWYPNYENNEVQIKLMLTFLNYECEYMKNFVRICVWGADDFGLEMDFENQDEKILQNKYNEWYENIFNNLPEICNEEYFRKLGFHNA